MGPAPRNRSGDAVTRGGWAATGTAAGRRAVIGAAPGSRARRTRQAVLDAARRAFARHGYAETTVDHIVAEAGLARGSFYTYFESKAHVFHDLAASIDERAEREVTSFPRVGDPVANLAVSNRRYLHVVRAHADLYRLIDEVAVQSETVRKARLRSHQRHVARVTRSIRRWQQTGWAEPDIDAGLVAAALVSMLSGFARWLHVAGDSYDEDRAAAALTEICVRACGLADPGGRG